MTNDQRKIFDTLQNYLLENEEPKSLLHAFFMSFEHDFEHQDFIRLQEINNQFENGNVNDALIMTWDFHKMCIEEWKQGKRHHKIRAYMCKCLCEGNSVKNIYATKDFFILCDTCHHLMVNRQLYEAKYLGVNITGMDFDDLPQFFSYYKELFEEEGRKLEEHFLPAFTKGDTEDIYRTLIKVLGKNFIVKYDI